MTPMNRICGMARCTEGERRFLGPSSADYYGLFLLKFDLETVSFTGFSGHIV